MLKKTIVTMCLARIYRLTFYEMPAFESLTHPKIIELILIVIWIKNIAMVATDAM